MSKAGKSKGKKGKGLPTEREEETRFIEGGADTGQKHGKSRGATAVPVPRSGDGPILETSSSTDHGASGEVDQSKTKKKKTSGPFNLARTLSLGRSSSHSPKPSSKKNVQSPTSGLATVGGASKQSEVCRYSLKTVRVFILTISDPSLPNNDRSV